MQPFIMRTKLFKFLIQCFARLRFWKKRLKFTKPTCWINSCFAGDIFRSKTEVMQNTDLNILAP